MTVGTSQWGRELTVSLGDLEFTHTMTEPSFRCSFLVEREFGATPPRCELAIWGLSEDTRAKLESTAQLPCSIEAGYTGGAGLVFEGIVRKGTSTKEGADWIFRATASDEASQQSTEKRKARVNFKEGTPLSDVLKGLVKAAGLKPGNVALLGIPFVSDIKLAGGADKLEKSIAVYGDGLEELDNFTRSCGIIWLNDDGVFKGANAGMFTAPGPLLSYKTGLVHPPPRFNDKGHAVGQALLNPDLRPGVGFTVVSERVNGAFIASRTRHKGDTDASSDWIVEFVGVPPDGFNTYLAERYRGSSRP
jgi:hypothetical protein